MLKRIKPSPAMAVALLALFVALGGGAYAATNLPANSVGTAQLRNGAVTVHKLGFDSVGTRRIQDQAVNVHKLGFNSVGTRRIQNGAVNNEKIQNNAVTSGKIADGQVMTADLADGAVTRTKLSPTLNLDSLANWKTTFTIPSSGLSFPADAPGRCIPDPPTKVSVAGAVVGDFVIAKPEMALAAGLRVDASVTAADTLSGTICNDTSEAQTVAGGTVISFLGFH